MSDNWIVQNLNSALETWNEKLSEIWMLLSQDPEKFKGGAIWDVMNTVNGALKGIGYGLLVLFFAVGIVKTCGSFAEVNFHLRTRADTPLLRTEYQTCNKHLLLTEKSG